MKNLSEYSCGELSCDDCDGHRSAAAMRIVELEREISRLQMELDASCNAEELRQMRAKNARINDLLNPRMWTLEMSTAWHKNIPDVHAAFAALRSLPNAPISDSRCNQT